MDPVRLFLCIIIRFCSLNKLLSVISAGNINLDYLYVTYSSLSRNPVAILRCSDLSEVEEFLSSRGYHSLSRLD